MTLVQFRGQPMTNHIISTHQFSDRQALLELFRKADACKRGDYQLIPWGGHFIHSNYVFFVLFYEPSTRTRFSFETAILKLGGQVVSSESAAQFSSAIKGESLEDTIRVLAEYQPTAIILRHPVRGAAERAVHALPPDSGISIINAGDGDGQHPTQSILDAYTIFKEVDRLDNLQIALVGDCKYSRTIHSLIHLLKYSQKITFHLVAPKELTLPQEYLDILNVYRIPYISYQDVRMLPKDIDIVYATRIQTERLEKNKPYRWTEDWINCRIDTEWAETLKPEARILHPLPRIGEINPNLDGNPRAAYFRQAGNGLPIRMALLSEITKFPYPYCEPFLYINKP